MTRTVLIVDDDPYIRKLLSSTLRDVGGFATAEAGDGVDALERLREDPPELVFLDIDMPRLDGIETCRRLRAMPEGAGVHVVMLTAASSEDAEARAREAGADRFLTKPFSPLELLRIVDALGGTRA